MQEVRRQAPQLPQEELLVLCALTLFEKSENLQRYQENESQAQDLVGKMLEPVHNLFSNKAMKARLVS